MKYPNKDYIEHLRRKYPPGTRLQLSCMEDEMAVPPGSQCPASQRTNRARHGTRRRCCNQSPRSVLTHSTSLPCTRMVVPSPWSRKSSSSGANQSASLRSSK